MSYEVVRLGDACKVTGGFAFKSTDYLEEGIPLIRIGNIENEKINIKENAVCVDEKFLNKCQNFIVNKGDILVALSGATTGKFGIYDLDDISLLNQRIGRIIPNLEKIDNKFILFILYVLKDKILSSAGGVAQPNISPKEIESFQIPLPPLDIQKKIAHILDKAQELIDKRKEQISALDKFLENLFLDMFGDPVRNPMGWEEEKFSYFAKIDTRMTKEFDKYAEYPHIGIANIEKDSGKLINYLKVKDENLISGKYLFDERHIIYSKIRPNLNKVALPNFKGLSSADSYPILIKSENSNRYFFAHILRSSFFLSYILQHSDRTNIPKVNKEQLEGFECYAPPLDLQNQFASIVEKVEAEKTKLEASLKEMEDNFNSIMQRAFKGELF